MTDAMYLRDQEGNIWVYRTGEQVDNAYTIDLNGNVRGKPFNTLRNELGPLHILKFTKGILDKFPTFTPDTEYRVGRVLEAEVPPQSCRDGNHDWRVTYHGPYGEGMLRHLRKTYKCANCPERAFG